MNDHDLEQLEQRFRRQARLYSLGMVLILAVVSYRVAVFFAEGLVSEPDLWTWIVGALSGVIMTGVQALVADHVSYGVITLILEGDFRKRRDVTWRLAELGPVLTAWGLLVLAATVIGAAEVVLEIAHPEGLKTVLSWDWIKVHRTEWLVGLGIVASMEAAATALALMAASCDVRVLNLKVGQIAENSAQAVKRRNAAEDRARTLERKCQGLQETLQIAEARIQGLQQRIAEQMPRIIVGSGKPVEELEEQGSFPASCTFEGCGWVKTKKTQKSANIAQGAHEGRCRFNPAKSQPSLGESKS